MAGFLIGIMIGGFIGVLIMAMMNAASRADDETEHYYSEKEL